MDIATGSKNVLQHCFTLAEVLVSLTLEIVQSGFLIYYSLIFSSLHRHLPALTLHETSQFKRKGRQCDMQRVPALSVGPYHVM